MAKVYDTAQLRRTASLLLESAEDMQSALQSGLRWIGEDASSRLDGETAHALAETSENIDQRLARCAKDVDSLGELLKRYAFLLDEADEKISETIQAR